MPFQKYDLRIAVTEPVQPHRLDLESYVPFFLIAISNKLTANSSRVLLREFDCGVTEWRVLAMLAIEPGIPPGRITSVVGIDKSSVSRALKILQERGCVVIDQDPGHRRRQILSLTPEGQALHDRIILRALARQELLLTGFAAEERRVLVSFLKRLLRNVPLVAEAAAAEDDSAQEG